MNKMKLLLEYVNCPICGCEETKFLYKKPDTRFFLTDFEFPVVKCKRCSLGYVNPRPVQETISYFYPEQFYSEVSRGIESKFNRRRYPIQARYFKDLPRGSKILDIGCATGSFARYLSDNFAFDVYGTDLIKPSGLHHDPTKLHFGPISELNYSDNFFDGICSWAVFEHLHDPITYFLAVHQLLKPGGQFIFLVTNLNSIFSRFAYGEDIPRHLVFYTTKSLNYCARQSGLTTESIEHSNEIYGGAGFNVLQRRFLHLCGANWKQIFGYESHTPSKRLPLIIRIICKCLSGLGYAMIPPRLETFLGISGIMIVTMEKSL